ncbi:MAG: hypothetical protein II951_10965 [Bacteroidales bacterium]|nr:hypothetical protein [Bacteroidales bacterium]
MKGCLAAAVVLFGLLCVGLFKYYWVFGEGVKAGELNYIVKKGYVFKTYEGKLIQAGFKADGGSAIQSYEFMFSVERPEIADSLMRCSGRTVELYYKEYKGTLPWRGMSEYVVDSIVSVQKR